MLDAQRAVPQTKLHDHTCMRYNDPSASELNHWRERTARRTTRLKAMERELLAQRSPDLLQIHPLNITDRLPPELLSHIFQLVVVGSSGIWRQEWVRHLVSVSRRWRDVIYNRASFWTTVVVHGSRGLSSVSAHLTRSRNCLLDIEIRSFRENEFPRLRRRLTLLIVHVRRWRSLELCVDGKAMQLSLDLLSTMTFPSLTRALIQSSRQHRTRSLCFLKAEQSPVLGHLEIEGFVWDDVPLLPTLASLKSKDMRCFSTSMPPFLSQLSSMKLTALSVSGSLDTRWLLSDSLHLPHLERLTLDRTWKAKEVLEAIVAPKLEYFDYSAIHNSASDIFGSLGSKYNSVRQLAFYLDHRVVLYLDRDGAEAVCLAFSGIRHATIWLAEIDSFFLFIDDSCPADHWTSLEHLTINTGDIGTESSAALNGFVHWINRRVGERHRLHIKFMGTFADQRLFRLLDGIQKERCTLEMGDLQSLNFG